jgi:hypothetical protein
MKGHYKMNGHTCLGWNNESMYLGYNSKNPSASGLENLDQYGNMHVLFLLNGRTIFCLL